MFPIGQPCALSKDIIYGFQWDDRIGTASWHAIKRGECYIALADRKKSAGNE